MTVVMTSDPQQPSGGVSGHRDALHRLLGDIITAVRADRSAKLDPAES
ncbi:hypothetical protein [Stutzerimonas urumqiensis]|nr:hypothetical protein [Stutzerimonas urumqiensis]